MHALDEAVISRITLPVRNRVASSRRAAMADRRTAQ
jgi:hypothetical protein